MQTAARRALHATAWRLSRRWACAARSEGGLRCRSSSSSTALTFAEKGEPLDVLQETTRDDGDVGDQQIRVRMLAAPVHPSDVNTVQGVYPITPRYDNIPGHEGVGEVVATGAAVSALTPGDRVVPLAAGLGTWRTGGVWEAADWFRVDPALPLADAATLTINPGTALSMLEQFVALEAGDAVVQNGANSAVGEYVIQLAHHKGVKTVNMVRDRGDWAGLHAHLTRLGADLVATPESVREQARTAGLPAPRIALNCVGGESATTQAKMLAAGGVHVTYGGLSRQPVTVPTPVLLFRDVAVRGFWISGNSEAARDAGKKREMLQRLQKLILDGVIAARCTELPFSRWREAFQAGTNRGRKMLLVMGGDES